ncbi:type IV secretion system protein VirB3 [Oligella urethralis]|uniref:VirB3 family type IV secretion system protein n=1 Tax=Oligella urethralis TaxID=90245 RepID=UPI000DFD4A45|nr:VirB3 family type IV secretion system protein [Oligella urethralis]SUA61631.1 type IV secretion system protein VirB3 [Oligella urethralis]
MNEELNEYPTFGALARSAMAFGIPIMALAVIMGVTVIFMMIGIMTVGVKGMLILTITIPLLLMIRTISKTDDRAINVLAFELLCLLKRRNAKAFWGTNTILSAKYGLNKNDYIRLNKQIAEQTAGSRRLAAKNKLPH